MAGRGGRGRGRGRGRGSNAGTTSSRPKRAASPDSEYDDAAPAKKPRTGKEKPTPRAPSSRSTKGHMAEKPDFELTVTKTYRSHSEVEAEKEKRAAAAAARDQKMADAMATIAKLNAESDRAAVDEENDAVDSLNDLREDDTTMLEFTDADFARIENDGDYESAGEYAPKIKSVPGRKAKPKKGETRAGVEELTKALKEKSVGAKKNAQNSDAAAASKKAGLRKAFVAQPGASPGKFEYGGLTEEDADSTRPDLDGAKAPVKRVNDLVLVSSDSSSDDETPLRVPAPVPRPVAKPRAVQVKFEPKIPALVLASDDAKTPKLAKTKKKGVKLEAESSAAGFFTPDTAGDVKGLPALVGPTWDSHLLPAMYRALAVSTEPMTFTAHGESAAACNAAVKAMRTVVDQVHPGNTLPEFVWGDKICSRVVSRVRERRCLLVQAGVDAVDSVFQTKEFVGNPAAIREYAKYAIRVDGPAFWKVPTPRSSPPESQSAWLHSDGFMESSIIIKAASAIMARLTAATYRVAYLASLPPVSSAVFKRYTATGVREEKLPKFTRKLGSPRVAEFMNNIRRFTLSRWTSLLDALEPTTTAAPVSEAADELDSYGDFVYVPSSP
ncbi:hypothetical protein C8F04DRAFT_1281955 [Mycena alexandri]|uniref:Uncharacterized protein n=1 Tax=Mycena alexandri TaxID=1745969 RepID=A0AAD6RW93_9AGAR|nr:hypothetical protein C8F04DRAFT_1281955 [Mycena alexandri]